MEDKEFWRSRRPKVAESRSTYRRSKLTLDVDDPQVVLFFVPYDQLSEPLSFGDGKYFQEEIAPFAFSDSIRRGDVFCFYDHNYSRVLGHQSSNFSIKEKRDGLRCRVKLEYGPFYDSVLDAVAAGQLQASVGFKVLEERWPRKDLRIVEEGKLIEISLVHSPAYKSTSSCMSPPPGKEIVT